jgi:hypothetical protein
MVMKPYPQHIRQAVVDIAYIIELETRETALYLIADRLEKLIDEAKHIEAGR